MLSLLESALTFHPLGKDGFSRDHSRDGGKRKHIWNLRTLTKPERMSFARFSTDDMSGTMRGRVRFTNDPLNTFGGAGVVEIPQLQRLLRFICERALEHPVAANLSTVAGAVHEASSRYLGWDIHSHASDNGTC